MPEVKELPVKESTNPVARGIKAIGKVFTWRPGIFHHPRKIHNEDNSPLLSRRALFQVGALVTAAAVSSQSVNEGWKAANALLARKEPQEPVDGVNSLTLKEIETIYNQTIDKLTDPEDGRPIIYIPTFHQEQLPAIENILRIQYNQLDKAKRPAYPEFVTSFIQQAVDISYAFGIHPAVFLQTYIVSGQNAGGIAGQHEDVDIYRKQVAMNWVQDGIPVFGTEIAKKIQEKYTFPIGTYTLYDVIRVLNPTVGAMDMEPWVYAKAYMLIAEKYPEAAKRYFGKFPEAVSSMMALVRAGQFLDAQRDKLQQKAEQFLIDNPDVLEEFSDIEKGQEAWMAIGASKLDFGYTRSTALARQFDEFQGRDLPKGTEDEKKTYIKAREDFILRFLLYFHREAGQYSPAEAKKSLMGDQVFNPRFIDYLKKKVGDSKVVELEGALRQFNGAAYQLRQTRFDSYISLGRVEYDPEFQTALSVATTRYLLEDVQRVFPALVGLGRQQLYWQMYMISALREISPLESLAGSFLRPDINPPYNNAKVLESIGSFKDYLIGKGQPTDILPDDFYQFFVGGNQFGTWQRSMIGGFSYSAFWRADDICSKLLDIQQATETLKQKSPGRTEALIEDAVANIRWMGKKTEALQAIKDDYQALQQRYFPDLNKTDRKQFLLAQLSEYRQKAQVFLGWELKEVKSVKELMEESSLSRREAERRFGESAARIDKYQRKAEEFLRALSVEDKLEECISGFDASKFEDALKIILADKRDSEFLQLWFAQEVHSSGLRYQRQIGLGPMIDEVERRYDQSQDPRWIENGRKRRKEEINSAVDQKVKEWEDKHSS